VCSTRREMEKSYNILVGSPVSKLCEAVDWINLVRDDKESGVSLVVDRARRVTDCCVGLAARSAEDSQHTTLGQCVRYVEMSVNVQCRIT
jgi:hypothetical protein